MATQIDPEDGGYSSRKFILVGAAIVLVTAVACLATKIPSIDPLYATFCGTVSGLVAIYCGSSAFVQHIATRDNANANAQQFVQAMQQMPAPVTTPQVNVNVDTTPAPVLPPRPH